MNIKELAEMIDIDFGITLALGGILQFCLYLKLDKIYDELKEIRKGKKDVKHGKWIRLPDGWDGVDEYERYKCSVCNQPNSWGDTPFCKWCGADMRGVKDTNVLNNEGVKDDESADSV